MNKGISTVIAIAAGVAAVAAYIKKMNSENDEVNIIEINDDNDQVNTKSVEEVKQPEPTIVQETVYTAPIPEVEIPQPEVEEVIISDEIPQVDIKEPVIEEIIDFEPIPEVEIPQPEFEEVIISDTIPKIEEPTFDTIDFTPIANLDEIDNGQVVNNLTENIFGTPEPAVLHPYEPLQDMNEAVQDNDEPIMETIEIQPINMEQVVEEEHPAYNFNPYEQENTQPSYPEDKEEAIREFENTINQVINEQEVIAPESVIETVTETVDNTPISEEPISTETTAPEVVEETKQVEQEVEEPKPTEEEVTVELSEQEVTDKYSREYPNVSYNKIASIVRQVNIMIGDAGGVESFDLQHIILFKEKYNRNKYQSDMIQKGLDAVFAESESDVYVNTTCKNKYYDVLDDILKIVNTAVEYEGRYRGWTIK